MANRPAQAEVESFIRDWVAGNFHVEPDPSNMALEVDRLAADLTGAARHHGISGGDMHRAVGDIDAYLTEHYVRTSNANPELPLAD